MEPRWDEIHLPILFIFPSSSPLPLYFSLLFSFMCFLFPALCWLARLQSQGTPEIQISWRLFGRTRKAAYVSQVMCTQTCNLQIINVVLISHINSCHFVGIVSPRWSPGLLPAPSASECAFSAPKREWGVRRKIHWLEYTHRQTHSHINSTRGHLHIQNHTQQWIKLWQIKRKQRGELVTWALFLSWFGST